jgi:peptide/nickel transport system permease protein
VNLVHGRLGYSFQFSAGSAVSGISVATLIGERIGSSLQLVGAAVALVVIFGVPLGMLAGALTREGRHRRLEVLFTGVTSVLGAIPDYLSGTILAFVFAVELRVLPVSSAGINGLILPAVAVAIAPTAYVARIARVETLNVLAQDYIRTARAKRLPRRVIMFRHALPNIATSVLTVSGLIFSALIGGTILVEAVFNRPGLGTELVQAIVSTDYPTVQGVILVLGSVVIAVNLFVDIVLAIVDPRNLTRNT